MRTHRRFVVTGCLGGALLLCLAHAARAEFALFLGSGEVLAVDLADDSVVSRFGIPGEAGTAVRGLERASGGFVLADADGAEVWSVDEGFAAPSFLFDLPAINTEGIAYHGNDLFVNGQAPKVPPDTLFVLDGTTGDVLQRFAMPDTVRGLKDLTSDGSNIWAVDATQEKLWRIDPSTGTFELSHDLPGPLIFAVAWNAAGSELWLFQSAQGNDIVGYTVDRVTGAATEAMRVEKAATPFVFAATFSDAVTPSASSSWGALKSRFAR